MKTRHILIFCGMVTLLSSCSGVRNCRAPQLDLPGQTACNAVDSLTASDIEWWKLYSDSSLTYIIEETLTHNRDILAAAARVEQLRELYGIEKMNLAPTLSAIASADNETNDYYNDKYKSEPEYALKATLSWEADLWGGMKWSRRKGAADYRASIEQERGMRVILIAEAASAYFRLMALDNELSIVKRTLYTREENLKKAKLRYEGGLTPETVYRQAQVEYASTAALIPELERRIQEQNNAITLLMGRYPGEIISRSHLSPDEALTERLPTVLPSTLLQRRPDLREAEASLQASLAAVGVAYADRFPRLRISLTGGLENDELQGFFQSPFSYILGSLTGTVFDFGRNKRRYKAAIAAYEQSRLNYEQKVLTAFHEADDAVTAFKLIRQSTTRRRELRDAAQKYAQLAYIQYNMGVINYIDVLDASRRYFEAQVGLSNAVRDQYLAMVQLYKVLGGGWEFSRDTVK